MKLSLKNISTLIFDMDGVITDTMPYHYRAWKEIFSQNGISVSRLQVYSREGQKGIQSVLEIFNHLPDLPVDGPDRLAFRS